LATSIVLSLPGVSRTTESARAGSAREADRVDDPAPADVLSSTIPSDVATIPDAIKDDPLQQLPRFDDFSWRSFIALNWPAATVGRGIPDTKKQIGDQSQSVVWESWKSAYELFQPGGEIPSEWDSYDGATPCPDIKGHDARTTKILAMFSQGEDINQAGFTEVPVGPLVAQNRTYVRYEIRVNRPEFDFIRGDPLDRESKPAYYLRENLPSKSRGAPPLAFPFGSIEVKAEWKVFNLPDEAAALDRYYHREAIVRDPVTNACETRTVGLVGLHIIQKTPTRPQWIWSTFEHVDNVTLGAGAPAALKPAFNDPAGPQANPPGKPRVINMIPKAVVPNPKPVQVVRLRPIHPSTAKTNGIYQAKLAGKVWQNYQLVLTQWPTAPEAADFKPFPSDPDNGPFQTGSSVANVTMETGTPMQTKTSCMGCHSVDNKTYATGFVWFLDIQAVSRIPAINEAAMKNAATLLDAQVAE
jgi:hypothetical protein